MKKLIFLITVGFLFGLFNGCSTTEPVTRIEQVEFAGIPEVSRVDNGAPNKEGQVRIGGHFSYKYDEPGKKIYKKNSVDTNFLNQVTVTNYTSIFYEPRGSFGGEITYSFNNLFGLGGHMDYAAVTFTDDADLYIDNKLSTVRTGIHGRFTKAHRFMSVGYRPELSFGKFQGLKTAADSTQIIADNEIVRKLFITFDQSMVVCAFPVEMAGIFVGLKHQVRPVAVIDDYAVIRNRFLFYGGVGMEFLEMLSINVYCALPIADENRDHDIPAYIGFSIGLLFNGEGDYDE
jgi:hypothetical protein